MRTRGFTLIELLIVVVIIGILATIAIPQFDEVRQRAFNSTVLSDIRTVVAEIERYATIKYAFPADEDALFANGLVLSPGVSFMSFSVSNAGVPSDRYSPRPHRARGILELLSLQAPRRPTSRVALEVARADQFVSSQISSVSHPSVAMNWAMQTTSCRILRKPSLRVTVPRTSYSPPCRYSTQRSSGMEGLWGAKPGFDGRSALADRFLRRMQRLQRGIGTDVASALQPEAEPY